MARNFLKSSLQNASFNIIFQILCRCVTFGLNAFVLRHVSPAVVGVMNVRLLLLESTILFLSREAFRRACLSKTTEHNWAQVINLLWLTVPLCQVLCLVFGYVWLYVLTPPTEDITQHYVLGVWAICISCIIEMCCEPLHLVSQAFLFVRLKVVLDSIHIAVRTVTFTLLVIHNPQEAVVAFSVAQVLAVCVFVVSHYIYFYHYIKQLRHRQKKEDSDVQPASVKLLYVRRDSLTEAEDEFPFESLSDFLPAWLSNEPCIDPGLSKLTWSFFKQGILKQVLTEGERYVMTLFSVLTFAEQGVYDVVNNLSSLAARFLFRPVEDSSYFYFSQMISREASISDQNQKHMAESVQVLHHVLRCITCVGLVILVFGQSYSRLLLHLYGGAGLAEGVGPTLMSTQCLAVLLLAVNGVTECYTFATMSTVQLDRYNYLMAVLSIVFLVLSWGLTRLLGAVGFILANCCNMAARIAHSVVFIGERYRGTKYEPLSGLVPGRYFLSSLLISALSTKLSEMQFYEEHKFLHLFIGAAFFAVLCGAWLYEEHELVGLALQRWRHKPVDKQH